MEKNQRNQVFHCSKCGLTVEVLSPGMSPVCCGEAMLLMKENTVDAVKEKHVPTAALFGPDGTIVRVGSMPHPMTEAHYIEWIEVINKDYVNRKYLKPGDAPEAVFYVKYDDTLEVRAYCNLHGLWKKL